MAKSNELDQVIELIAPPAKPMGLERTWKQVEDEIEVRLPSDYKEFIDQYGDGVIAGSGVEIGYIGIWNLRSKRNSLQGIQDVLTNYAAERKTGHDFAYNLYPSSGGLLPCGGTPNGDHFNWRTIGDPDTWDIVFYAFDSAKMILLEGHSLIRVLRDILTHESMLVPSEFGPEIMSPPYRFTKFNW